MSDEDYDPVYPLGKPKNRKLSPDAPLTQEQKDAKENWLPIPGPVGLERNKITGKVRTTSAGTIGQRKHDKI